MDNEYTVNTKSGGYDWEVSGGFLEDFKVGKNWQTALGIGILVLFVLLVCWLCGAFDKKKEGMLWYRDKHIPGADQTSSLAFKGKRNKYNAWI